MSKKYDFSGWATRYGVRCSDGRTILPGAFSDDDSVTVPLVWNHQHNDPFNVLGFATLKHCAEGVKAYCSFNDTEAGNTAKKMVQHGDVTSLSIYANQLKENVKAASRDVIHGAIKEVSLVLASANPEAKIDAESFAHSDDGEEHLESAFIRNAFDPFENYLEHSEENDSDEDDSEELEHSDDSNKEDKEMAGKAIEDMTVDEVFDSIEKKITPEEAEVMYGVIGAAAAEGADEDEEDEEDAEMKHNVFDSDYEQGNFLTHSDEGEILELAKKTGSFKDAMNYFAEENGKTLSHADGDPAWGPAPVGGFTQNTSVTGNVTALFPDYKDLKTGAPDLITDDQSWQERVISKAHKLPFSRVRTGQVDIRHIDALRAKGYPQKGAYKKYSGNFQLVRRTTDPQTVYVKNALHRDDIIDITDFDYVQYLYNIDQMMLKDEIATAMLFGDGRADTDEDKIQEDKIRPIWKDDELYTLHGVLDLNEAAARIQGTGTGANFSQNYILAEAFIEKVLYMREKFKGTGTPDMYITPHMVNVMLLSRDRNGRRIYDNVNELKAALNVNEIVTVEQMADLTRTDTKTGKTYKLDALFVNLADYALGSTKGGEITHFTQFDIDFNQQKSLIETRLSGALTKVWSAMVIEEEVVSNDTNNDEEPQG